MSRKMTSVGVTAGLGITGMNVSLSATFGASDGQSVRALFALLESKRVFQAALDKEDPSSSVASVLEVKKDATAVYAAARNLQLRKEAKRIVDACNAFLSAAGKDGEDFVGQLPRFDQHLSLLRRGVANACKILGFDFDVPVPGWVSQY
ncbi:hypothetical protein [Rhodococcus sp. Chr-9]|uniref:hypothetical protein n=1 Tax=Rhodococcus sp. Chr-9 TaxID=713612 RepID=UPI000573BD41|nr:hypothetical protein [Rhodococcus sp. Chr-9]KHJ74169.1 hypothetical protein QR64_03015 [Rhodococcus sp. Chr-9]